MIFSCWQYVRYLGVRKRNIWYRFKINSDNKSRECKREKIDNSAGFLLSKISSLGSFKVVLDWRLVNSKTVIITQPLFSLRTTICCWDIDYFCMGNMQNNKGFCFDLQGMLFIPQYIAHSSTPNQSPLIQYYQLQSFLVTNFSLFKKMALINLVHPPLGTLKVNVHAAAFAQQMPNGNTNVIGVVLRTSDGNLVNFIA